MRDLTFSNTMKWGKYEWSAADNLSRTNQNILKNLPVVPFPTNMSDQTKNELEELVKKQKKLTKKTEKGYYRRTRVGTHNKTV